MNLGSALWSALCSRLCKRAGRATRDWRAAIDLVAPAGVSQHRGPPQTMPGDAKLYQFKDEEGVEHDLRVLRGDGLAVAGAAPFTAVFDYVFASDSLEVVGVQPPLDEARSAIC